MKQLSHRIERNRHNSRLPAFTERFRAAVDKVGGISKASELLSISRPTVSYWYYGERTPDAVSLLQIAASFELSADFLIGLSDVPVKEIDVENAVRVTGLNLSSIYFLRDLDKKSLEAVNLLLDECHGGNYLFWDRLHAYLFTPERGGFDVILETGNRHLTTKDLLSGLIQQNLSFLDSLRAEILEAINDGKHKVDADKGR